MLRLVQEAEPLGQRLGLLGQLGSHVCLICEGMRRIEVANLRRPSASVVTIT